MIPAQYRKLRHKVLGLLGLGILSVGLIAIFSFTTLSGNVDLYDKMMANEVNAANIANNINLNFKRQVQEWKNVLLRGHVAKDREKYWTRFNEYQEQIQSQVDEFLRLDVSDKSLSDIRHFKEMHRNLLPKYNEGYQIFLDNNFSHQLADKAVRGIDRDPTKLVESVTNRLNDSILQHSAENRESASQSVTYGTVAIIFAIVASSILTTIFMNTKVVYPIIQLIDHLRNVSKGDFATELSFYRSDEIGSMSKAIEVLRQKLMGICSEMTGANEGLKQVCFSLNESANAISHGVSEQNKGTDMVSRSMESMVDMGKHISQSASNAASAASEAENSANKSIAFMQETIDTITHSSTQIKDTATVISKLDDDAKNVGTVLDVIKSIAEQTNLLALNAAIEAARAGEQGRGFAVVADEVRTLAARTQQSTEEIQQIIANVQTGAQNAVKAIEQGEMNAQLSVKKVYDADRNLKSITSAIGQISTLNNQIADSIQEQSNVAQTINNNLRDLKEIAKVNQVHAESCQEDNETLVKMEALLAGQIAHLKGQKSPAL
ncbi:methyl-accepting chemotaxis protein [Paraneptunicella aestuarii]|uniref:methyl-accepting chemotaxis protein n=1 Tax=Paraneptunicella aestuarii TaxID=2831148 RepID=UPI001E4D29EC|nr:methyl-accepting chemotaxis protein [Paraneptunicella aestuarii]UAA39389.1 methyl-accepting chemotaxis protein [Paraneptunicella aestuarii]